MNTKPVLEKVLPKFGSSFFFRNFNDRNSNSQPYWHFHPELEIVYVGDGSGKRHIGNHISYYNEGNLIFLGPNLPHLGFTDRLSGQHNEIVVQMKEDFLGSNFLEVPEMKAIQQLFERSRLGLSFHGTTKKEVGERLERMTLLEGFDRLLAFLRVLEILANSTEYKILNANGYALDVEVQDHERINTIYQFVRKHFQREIPLSEIADEVNMTIPAFCRYFKKLTHKTFTHFVNEFRVVHACKLLSEQQLPISEVCFESGFNNLSHFNKSFRKITEKSPTEYRKDFRKIIG